MSGSKQSISGDIASRTWYGPTDPLMAFKETALRMIETAPEGKRQLRGSEHCRLKRKLAINPFVDGYLFPTIELHIIHKIDEF